MRPLRPTRGGNTGQNSTSTPAVVNRCLFDLCAEECQHSFTHERDDGPMTDAMMQEEGKRTRDAAATRDAILAAACECFVANDYEHVGLREIAAKAGVTAALINRYFGTKEMLFRTVLETRPVDAEASDSSLQALMTDRDNFGMHLARRVLNARRNKANFAFDPMLVVLRSAGQPAAQAVLRERMTLWLTPLARELGGCDAAIRAEMILAILVGFDLLRNVILMPGFAEGDEELLVKRLGAALQAQLDD